MALSQVPGYLGKKTSIGGSFGIFPAPKAKFEGTDSLIGVNVRFGLEGERVLSRKHAVGVGLHWLTARFQYNLDDRNGYSRIYGLEANAFIKFYHFKRRGNIAPLGTYHKFEALALAYQAYDLDRIFFDDRRRFMGTYYDIGFKASLGTQRAIDQNLLINFEIQIATVLGMFNGRLDPEVQELHRLTTERLQGHYFLSLRMGIAILN